MMILDFHVVQALLPTGNIAIVMATTRSTMGDRLCKHFVNMVKTIHVHALASEKVKSRVLSRSHPNNEHHIKNLRSGLWSHRWPKKVVKRGWKILHILYMDDLCMYKIVFIWHDICVAIFLEDIPTTFHYQTAKSTATGQSAIPRAEKALTRQRSSVQGLLGQPTGWVSWIL